MFVYCFNKLAYAYSLGKVPTLPRVITVVLAQETGLKIANPLSAKGQDGHKQVSANSCQHPRLYLHLGLPQKPTSENSTSQSLQNKTYLQRTSGQISHNTEHCAGKHQQSLDKILYIQYTYEIHMIVLDEIAK